MQNRYSPLSLFFRIGEGKSPYMVCSAIDFFWSMAPAVGGWLKKGEGEEEEVG